VVTNGNIRPAKRGPARRADSKPPHIAQGKVRVIGGLDNKDKRANEHTDIHNIEIKKESLHGLVRNK